MAENENGRPDTVPGFTMQSENFYMKFITGLQCGVSSKLLEYETDWYEVMEIVLSRLEDEPEAKEKFELIAARDLEYWARVQPGGDSLNLGISVVLEEKKYFEPPLGSRKALRLVFNDRFATQVVFHVRKKQLMKSLVQLSALAVAELIPKEETLSNLESELPQSLIRGVSRAYYNCWTPHFFRTKVKKCPASCLCKNMTNKNYVEQQLIPNTSVPDPMPVSPSIQEPDPVQPPQQDPLAAPSSVEEKKEEEPQPSTSRTQKPSRQGPKKTVSRKSKRMKAKNLKRKIRSENNAKECQTCSEKKNVSTRSSCGKSQKETKSEEVRRSPRNRNKYFNGLKLKIKSLHIEIESLVLKVKGKKSKKQPREEEKTENKPRKSSRLSALKKTLLDLNKSRKRKVAATSDEPGSGASESSFEPSKKSSRKLPESSYESSKKSSRKLPESSFEPSKKSSRKLPPRASSRENASKRTLRSQTLENSSAREKRKHS